MKREMTLKSYDDKTTAQYELKELILHEWQYAASGHFAAIVKQNSDWWFYSDEQSCALEETYILSSFISQNNIMAFYDLISETTLWSFFFQCKMKLFVLNFFS